MIYGIVSQVDDATTRAYFKNKRVPDVNVVYITQIASLVQMLKSGDVVFVVSVNRFASVSQFFQFGKFCMSHGVSLHLLAHPYLDLGNGKHWKPSVVSQMMRMVELERYAKANMTNGYKYSNEYWEHLCRTFEIMNLEVLAHTFSADGVLKCGS